MSTFPPHVEDFIAWACQDLGKAREILDRHPDMIRSTNALGETALHYLVIEDQAAAVSLLIARGADVNTSDFSGATPLHHAAQLGYVDLVRLLLSRSADVTAVDQNRETPLHLAARDDGKAEIVESLLKAGARVQASDGWMNPLDVAVKVGRHDLAALLRAAGGVETPRE